MRDNYIQETLARIREDAAEDRAAMSGVKQDVGEMSARMAGLEADVRGIDKMLTRMWYGVMALTLLLVNAQPKFAAQILGQLLHGLAR